MGSGGARERSGWSGREAAWGSQPEQTHDEPQIRRGWLCAPVLSWTARWLRRSDSEYASVAAAPEEDVRCWFLEEKSMSSFL